MSQARIRHGHSDSGSAQAGTGSHARESSNCPSCCCTTSYRTPSVVVVYMPSWYSRLPNIIPQCTIEAKRTVLQILQKQLWSAMLWRSRQPKTQTTVLYLRYTT